MSDQHDHMRSLRASIRLPYAGFLLPLLDEQWTGPRNASLNADSAEDAAEHRTTRDHGAGSEPSCDGEDTGRVSLLSRDRAEPEGNAGGDAAEQAHAARIAKAHAPDTEHSDAAAAPEAQAEQVSEAAQAEVARALLLAQASALAATANKASVEAVPAAPAGETYSVGWSQVFSLTAQGALLPILPDLSGSDIAPTPIGEAVVDLDAPPVDYAATPVSQFPYNSVVLIEATSSSAPGYFWIGSGAVIGPHTILTASHVLYNASLGVGYDNIYIYPGYSGAYPNPPGTNSPLSTSWSYHGFQVGNPDGTISAFHGQYDYAVINTSYTFSSWFGVTTGFSSGTVHMTGYPTSTGGVQDDRTGTVSLNSSYSLLNYGTIYSQPGNSGGPLWQIQNGSHQIVGVVSSDAWGVQLTADKWAQIQAWVAEDGYTLPGGGGGGGGLADLTSNLQSVYLGPGGIGVPSQPNITPGGQITVHFTISNIGGTAAGAGYGIYLSSSPSFASSTQIAWGVFFDAVQPGGTSPDGSTNVTLDTGLTPGTYYIRTVADWQNNVNESNESNNNSNSIAISVVAAGQPDLQPVSQGLSTYSLSPGGSTTVSYYIANLGSLAAASTLSGIYLSADSTITTSDTLLRTESTGSIAANSSVSESIAVTLSGSLAPGTYYLGVIADYNGALSESSESNNTTAGTAITVIPANPFTTGNDVVTVAYGGYTWRALAGHDSVTGSSGADIVYGDEGNDTIDGGAGIDQLFGGADSDTIVYDPSDNLANVLGGTGTDTLLIRGGSAPTSFNLTGHEFEQARLVSTDGSGQWWSTVTDYYNTSWQRTNSDVRGDDGRLIQTTYDVSGSVNWQYVSDYRNPSNVLTNQDGLFDNGGTFAKAFDYATGTGTDGVADWLREYTYFFRSAADQAAGRVLNVEGYADDGRKFTQTNDIDGNQAWTFQTDWYRTNGITLDFKEIRWDNGTTTTVPY